MSQDIRVVDWQDLVEPVIALAQAAGVDPVANRIFSIFLDDDVLIVRYIDEHNTQRHVSCKFNYGE